MVNIGLPIGITIGALLFILFKKNIEFNVGFILAAWTVYGAMIYL